MRVWEDLVISRQEAADLRGNSTEAWASQVDPVHLWWAGWHICPGPWALAATFDRKVSKTFLSESLWMLPCLPPCQIQSFQWIQRGHLWQVDFPFLPPECMDNPVCHPALHKHKLAFYQEALSPCPPWWAEAPKSKNGVSYLWGAVTKLPYDSTGHNSDTVPASLLLCLFLIFFFKLSS